MAAWMVGSCAAQAAPLVVSDQRAVQSQLQGAAQQVQLQVPAGAVVQLRFAGAGLHLDLRDAQGQHIRRLAENGRGVQTAMWWTQGAEHEQLWVVPAEKNFAAAPFTLQVLNTWQAQGAEQPKPDETPMGPQLKRLQQALVQGQSTEAFWQQVQQQGTPLVEPWEGGQLLVTFLWRDRGNQNVRLFGSPSGDHNPLRKLGGSDVWWTSVVMDPRARLSYALAPDVPKVANAAQQRRMILATLQRDPLNPHTFPAQLATQAVDRFQGRSVLQLPQAPKQPWVQARSDVPQGTLTRHVVHSQILGNDRDVWTYVPAGAEPQNLLVLFDAHAFVHDVPTPRILDNLMADGLLPNTAAVIVGNASPEARGVELPPNPKFAQFMAEELMPWVREQGLAQMARHTVVAGSSYGGLVSSYLGLMHPELFGNVLSMSGSYWWAPQGEPAGWMQRAWQTLPSPMPNVRFYIDAGRFETGRGGRNGILETSRELGDVLRARGLSVTQREWISGHDYVQWQASLGCGLVALLAPQKMADARMQVCNGVQK
ncbi:enterochelin esterase domain-containing protein [Comamonas kerstersii]|uniref:enterochelin esterase domain-containing protein n=1 Tax=Comamonas kerstersii TaxID=225992 RepID=UPI0026DD5BB8|nr:alpha/beta hydrolase-fold protein [Comamonas kerstersii]